METPRGSITVVRTSERDAGHRQVVLSLDGQRWATLMHGQTATVELPPGRHVLKADNTLMRKTIEFDLKPGEQSSFAVVNRAGPGTALFMLLGSPLLYLTLTRD